MTDNFKSEEKLIASEEPEPVGIHNSTSDAPWLFLCEHAGNRIPGVLDMIGLPQTEIDRHIGWDIGILDLAKGIADRLRSPLFFQRYSRLVIDCNRPLTSDELIPEKSENTVIPGNKGLSSLERKKRILEIWQPYQEAIREFLEEKVPPKPMVITLHSFTPVFQNKERPWHIGLLYNRCPEMALALKEWLTANDSSLNVGMNRPYRVSDEDDYTIPVFGEAMGFPHVLIEVRQDLINGWETRARWVDLFAQACRDLENVF